MLKKNRIHAMVLLGIIILIILGLIKPSWLTLAAYLTIVVFLIGKIRQMIRCFGQPACRPGFPLGGKILPLSLLVMLSGMVGINAVGFSLGAAGLFAGNIYLSYALILGLTAGVGLTARYWPNGNRYFIAFILGWILIVSLTVLMFDHVFPMILAVTAGLHMGLLLLLFKVYQHGFNTRHQPAMPTHLSGKKRWAVGASGVPPGLKSGAPSRSKTYTVNSIPGLKSGNFCGGIKAAALGLVLLLYLVSLLGQFRIPGLLFSETLSLFTPPITGWGIKLSSLQGMIDDLIYWTAPIVRHPGRYYAGDGQPASQPSSRTREKTAVDQRPLADAFESYLLVNSKNRCLPQNCLPGLEPQYSARRIALTMPYLKHLDLSFPLVKVKNNPLPGLVYEQAGPRSWGLVNDYALESTADQAAGVTFVISREQLQKTRFLRYEFTGRYQGKAGYLEVEIIVYGQEGVPTRLCYRPWFNYAYSQVDLREELAKAHLDIAKLKKITVTLRTHPSSTPAFGTLENVRLESERTAFWQNNRLLDLWNYDAVKAFCQDLNISFTFLLYTLRDLKYGYNPAGHGISDGAKYNHYLRVESEVERFLDPLQFDPSEALAMLNQLRMPELERKIRIRLAGIAADGWDQIHYWNYIIPEEHIFQPTIFEKEYYDFMSNAPPTLRPRGASGQPLAGPTLLSYANNAFLAEKPAQPHQVSETEFLDQEGIKLSERGFMHMLTQAWAFPTEVKTLIQQIQQLEAAGQLDAWDQELFGKFIRGQIPLNEKEYWLKKHRLWLTYKARILSKYSAKEIEALIRQYQRRIFNYHPGDRLLNELKDKLLTNKNRELAGQGVTRPDQKVDLSAILEEVSAIARRHGFPPLCLQDFKRLIKEDTGMDPKSYEPWIRYFFSKYWTSQVVFDYIRIRHPAYLAQAGEAYIYPARDLEKFRAELQKNWEDFQTLNLAEAVDWLDSSGWLTAHRFNQNAVKRVLAMKQRAFNADASREKALVAAIGFYKKLKHLDYGFPDLASLLNLLFDEEYFMAHAVVTEDNYAEVFARLLAHRRLEKSGIKNAQDLERVLRGMILVRHQWYGSELNYLIPEPVAGGQSPVNDFQVGLVKYQAGALYAIATEAHNLFTAGMQSVVDGFQLLKGIRRPFPITPQEYFVSFEKSQLRIARFIDMVENYFCEIDRALLFRQRYLQTDLDLPLHSGLEKQKYLDAQGRLQNEHLGINYWQQNPRLTDLDLLRIYYARQGLNPALLARWASLPGWSKKRVARTVDTLFYKLRAGEETSQSNSLIRNLLARYARAQPAPTSLPADIQTLAAETAIPIAPLTTRGVKVVKTSPTQAAVIGTSNRQNLGYFIQRVQLPAHGCTLKLVVDQLSPKACIYIKVETRDKTVVETDIPQPSTYYFLLPEKDLARCHGEVFVYLGLVGPWKVRSRVEIQAAQKKYSTRYVPPEEWQPIAGLGFEIKSLSFCPEGSLPDPVLTAARSHGRNLPLAHSFGLVIPEKGIDLTPWMNEFALPDKNSYVESGIQYQSIQDKKGQAWLSIESNGQNGWEVPYQPRTESPVFSQAADPLQVRGIPWCPPYQLTARDGKVVKLFGREVGYEFNPYTLGAMIKAQGINTLKCSVYVSDPDRRNAQFNQINNILQIAKQHRLLIIVRMVITSENLNLKLIQENIRKYLAVTREYPRLLYSLNYDPRLIAPRYEYYWPETRSEKLEVFSAYAELARFIQTADCQHQLMMEIKADEIMHEMPSPHLLEAFAGVDIRLKSSQPCLAPYLDRVNRHIRRNNLACFITCTQDDNLTDVRTIEKLVKNRIDQYDISGMIFRAGSDQQPGLFPAEAEAYQRIKYHLQTLLAKPHRSYPLADLPADINASRLQTRVMPLEQLGRASGKINANPEHTIWLETTVDDLDYQLTVTAADGTYEIPIRFFGKTLLNISRCLKEKAGHAHSEVRFHFNLDPNQPLPANRKFTYKIITQPRSPSVEQVPNQLAAEARLTPKLSNTWHYPVKLTEGQAAQRDRNNNNYVLLDRRFRFFQVPDYLVCYLKNPTPNAEVGVMVEIPYKLARQNQLPNWYKLEPGFRAGLVVFDLHQPVLNKILQVVKQNKPYYEFVLKVYLATRLEGLDCSQERADLDLAFVRGTPRYLQSTLGASGNCTLFPQVQDPLKRCIRIDPQQAETVGVVEQTKIENHSVLLPFDITPCLNLADFSQPQPDNSIYNLNTRYLFIGARFALNHSLPDSSLKMMADTIQYNQRHKNTPAQIRSDTADLGFNRGMNSMTPLIQFLVNNEHYGINQVLCGNIGYHFLLTACGWEQLGQLPQALFERGDITVWTKATRPIRFDDLNPDSRSLLGLPLANADRQQQQAWVEEFYSDRHGCSEFPKEVKLAVQLVFGNKAILFGLVVLAIILLMVFKTAYLPQALNRISRVPVLVLAALYIAWVAMHFTARSWNYIWDWQTYLDQQVYPQQLSRCLGDSPFLYGKMGYYNPWFFKAYALADNLLYFFRFKGENGKRIYIEQKGKPIVTLSDPARAIAYFNAVLPKKYTLAEYQAMAKNLGYRDLTDYLHTSGLRVDQILLFVYSYGDQLRREKWPSEKPLPTEKSRLPLANQNLTVVARQLEQDLCQYYGAGQCKYSMNTVNLKRFLAKQGFQWSNAGKIPALADYGQLYGLVKKHAGAYIYWYNRIPHTRLEAPTINHLNVTQLPPAMLAELDQFAQKYEFTSIEDFLQDIPPTEEILDYLQVWRAQKGSTH